MAAGIITSPGEEYGPCTWDCGHHDCRASRSMAASICHWCGKEIGYETRFYSTDRGLVHALCEELDAEAKMMREEGAES